MPRFRQISITRVFLISAATICLTQSVSAFATAKNTYRPINHLTVRNKNNRSRITRYNNSGDTNIDEEPPSSPNTETRKGTINPLRLAVLKLGLTELRYTSPLNYEKRPGTYICAGCGTPLFTSRGKYDSGSGWPSFWRTNSDVRSPEGGVIMKREFDGRVECSCSKCGGHLGHVFPDGPKRKDVDALELKGAPKSDLQIGSEEDIYSRLPRYCMNGAALIFEEEGTVEK